MGAPVIPLSFCDWLDILSPVSSRFICGHMSQDSFLLKLNDIPLCGWTMHGLSIHLLMDTRVA